MNTQIVHFRQRWDAFLSDDRGSATVEMVLLTPLLIIMGLFVVYCGRLADSTLRLNDAAHQAARAASIARSVASARDDARATAEAALAGAGIVCQNLAVTVNTSGLRPGSTVTVDVICTVGLSDLALPGVPGSKTLSASFSSPVDVHRGAVVTGGGG